jgi:hypothetical protein
MSSCYNAQKRRKCECLNFFFLAVPRVFLFDRLRVRSGSLPLVNASHKKPLVLKLLFIYQLNFAVLIFCLPCDHLFNLFKS